jgi:hypothetical protein
VSVVWLGHGPPPQITLSRLTDDEAEIRWPDGTFVTVGLGGRVRYERRDSGGRLVARSTMEFRLASEAAGSSRSSESAEQGRRGIPR